MLSRRWSKKKRTGAHGLSVMNLQFVRVLLLIRIVFLRAELPVIPERN